MLLHRGVKIYNHFAVIIKGRWLIQMFTTSKYFFIANSKHEVLYFFFVRGSWALYKSVLRREILSCM
jgi:hypothetical protein